MKKRVITLLCAIILSSLAVMAVGAYIKYEVLKPYGLGQDKNIMELPFLMLTDEDLQFNLELAQKGELDPEPSTEPTTEPTTPPTTEPPHTHSFEPVNLAPTCTQEGYSGYLCACGEKDPARWEIVPATGHDYACITMMPTCTEDGYICYRCFCGTEDDSRRETLSAAGHDYKRMETKPTCTKEGSYQYICDCGAEDESRKNPIPATGHSYALTEVAPTCTEPGYKTYRCSCGEKNSHYEETVPATGHDYKKSVVAPTCTQEGYTGYFCHCGAEKGTKEDIVPATGHTFIRGEEVPPTCTEEGKICYQCECGEEGSYYEEPIPAAGHIFQRVEIAATCTEGGYVGYRCSCGLEDEARREESIPATGHSYKDDVVAPTCKDKGYTEHTCSACGDSYTDSWTELSSHSYTSKEVKPTTSTEGYTEHTCTVCGDSYKDSYTEKLPEPVVIEPVGGDSYPNYDFSHGAVPESWFDDVLFVGDSRTDGLMAQGPFDNADFVCGTSRTVFKYVKDGDIKDELIAALQSKTYGKIFINLGINECGYAASSIIKSFKQLIELIRQYQPDAKIILQGIMAVTEKYAGRNDCFKSDNIAKLNEKMAELANGTDVFYIHANTYFTGSNGYLYSDLTGDGCHLKGNCYKYWADWIRYAVGQLGL